MFTPRKPALLSEPPYSEYSCTGVCVLKLGQLQPAIVSPGRGDNQEGKGEREENSHDNQ